MPPESSASATRAEGPLFGREDELARVSRLLGPEGALVTLIGPPGVGTSRLGREVASRSFTRTQLVPATRLSAAFAERARDLDLLVVDDVDADVLAVGEQLDLLRPLAPALRILVIGDEALGIDGEEVVLLDPPSEEAAVRLYIERMPAEARSTVREDDVRELVRRVRALPLAVELGALQAGTFSARDLVNAVGRSGALDLSRFRTARRSWPARRSSLEGAFAAALDALGAEERAVLAAIATFAAPPRLDDIDAMVDPTGTADPLAAVETLVRRQLVRRARTAGADAGAGFSRLELAPLLEDELRARARAGADARLSQLGQRHAEVVLARLEALTPRLYGPEAKAALDEIGAALPDVRAAFARVKDRDPSSAARLVVPLGELAAFARGIATDDPLFAAAVTAADAAGAAGDLQLRARTRHVCAKMLLEQNDPAAALLLLEEARSLVARDDVATSASTSLAADLERTRGWAALSLLDVARATEHFERALQAHRASRDPRGQADASAGLAVAARLAGEEARALRLFESSYGIHLVAGDTIRQAKVREMARLVGLALPDAGADHRDSAELRATADEHRASGRPWRDAISRLELARRLAQDGDRPGSRQALTEARASAELAGGNAEWIAALEAEVGAAAADVPGWRIVENATRVTAPDGARVDLRTRPVLRRILAALADVRVTKPGHALGVDAILAAGWPGERVQHAAGLLRVYTAIKRLRGLGLQTLVCTSEDGYLLDVSAPVTVG